MATNRRRMGASQLYWPDPFATMLAGLATIHDFFPDYSAKKVLADLDAD